MAPVYFIASYDITDASRYEQDYVHGVLQSLAGAGGEVIVASGSASVVEGAARGHTVVLRFPSEQAFRDWYADNASLVQLRLDTTTNTTAVLAKGFPGGTAAT